MESLRLGDYDSLDVAKLVALILFAEAHGFHQQQMIGAQPHTGAAEESAPAARQLTVAHSLRHQTFPIRDLLTRYAIPQTQPVISASPRTMAATKRQRLRR